MYSYGPPLGGVARSAGVVYYNPPPTYYYPNTKPQKSKNKNLRHSRQGGNLLRRRHFNTIPTDPWHPVSCSNTTMGGKQNKPQPTNNKKSHQLAGFLLF